MELGFGIGLVSVSVSRVCVELSTPIFFGFWMAVYASRILLLYYGKDHRIQPRLDVRDWAVQAYTYISCIFVCPLHRRRRSSRFELRRSRAIDRASEYANSRNQSRPGIPACLRRRRSAPGDPDFSRSVQLLPRWVQYLSQMVQNGFDLIPDLFLFGGFSTFEHIP